MTLTRAGRASDVRSARRLVQLAGLLFYVLTIQALVTAGVGISVYLQGGDPRDLVLPATGFALAGSYAAVGFHLRRYRVWARNFAFVFSAIGLFFLPVGTVLGAVVVLAIDRANRAGLFPARPTQPEAAEADERPQLLRLEPDFTAKNAG